MALFNPSAITGELTSRVILGAGNIPTSRRRRTRDRKEMFVRCRNKIESLHAREYLHADSFRQCCNCCEASICRMQSGAMAFVSDEIEMVTCRDPDLDSHAAAGVCQPRCSRSSCS